MQFFNSAFIRFSSKNLTLQKQPLNQKSQLKTCKFRVHLSSSKREIRCSVRRSHKALIDSLHSQLDFHFVLHDPDPCVTQIIKCYNNGVCRKFNKRFLWATLGEQMSVPSPNWAHCLLPPPPPRHSLSLFLSHTYSYAATVLLLSIIALCHIVMFSSLLQGSADGSGDF